MVSTVLLILSLWISCEAVKIKETSNDEATLTSEDGGNWIILVKNAKSHLHANDDWLPAKEWDLDKGDLIKWKNKDILVFNGGAGTRFEFHQKGQKKAFVKHQANKAMAAEQMTAGNTADIVDSKHGIVAKIVPKGNQARAANYGDIDDLYEIYDEALENAVVAEQELDVARKELIFRKRRNKKKSRLLRKNQY